MGRPYILTEQFSSLQHKEIPVLLTERASTKAIHGKASEILKMRYPKM